MTVTSVPPTRLKELRAAGQTVELIDVRTPVEYREVHVAFARNVPLDRLDPASLLRGRRPGEPLYVICKSGGRARQACERLLAAGCDDVVNVEGGTQACVEAGLPVVRGKKAVSLERQVRIAAGLLIVLGAVLAWVVHPVWAGLSAFVGAGLMYSGITDSCAMGLAMARMPWNRVGTPVSTCPVPSAGA